MVIELFRAKQSVVNYVSKHLDQPILFLHEVRPPDANFDACSWPGKRSYRFSLHKFSSPSFWHVLIKKQVKSFSLLDSPIVLVMES